MPYLDHPAERDTYPLPTYPYNESIVDTSAHPPLQPLAPVHQMSVAELTEVLSRPDGFALLAERFAREVVRRRGLMDLEGELAFLEWLATESGVEGELVGQALDQWFGTVGDALDQKLSGYHVLISEADARAAARKQMVDRLSALVKTDRSFVERLKGRLKDFFQARGMARWDGSVGRLRLVNNGGKAPIEVMVPVEQLPKKYRKVVITTSADLEAIRRDLEAGVKSATKVARLEDRGSHVRVE